MRKFLPVLISVVFVIVLIAPGVVFANHRALVLGTSTESTQLVFPTISAGPGFFLPDSPLFFLDKWFQTVRLAFAFSPERKAIIRSQIVGERMAELRIMLVKNNEKGISVALLELSEEARGVARHLNEASAQGRDIRDVVKQLHDDTKLQRQVLGNLASQVEGVLGLQLKAARDILQDAKITIADKLPEEQLVDEIEADLEQRLGEAIGDANEATSGLEHAVDILNKLASQAALRDQERREAALRQAIEVKNEALRRQQERVLNEEEGRQKDLLRVRQQAVSSARGAVIRVREALEQIQDAQETVKKAQQAVQPTTENLSEPGSSSE